MAGDLASFEQVAFWVSDVRCITARKDGCGKGSVLEEVVVCTKFGCETPRPAFRSVHPPLVHPPQLPIIHELRAESPRAQLTTNHPFRSSTDANCFQRVYWRHSGKTCQTLNGESATGSIKRHKRLSTTLRLSQ